MASWSAARLSSSETGSAAMRWATYGVRDAPGMSTVVISRPAAGVALLTLNRPDNLNAMDVTLVTELHAALDEVGGDRSCRAIVLTGAGRGFCAGLDLRGYGDAPDSAGPRRRSARASRRSSTSPRSSRSCGRSTSR